MNALYPSKGERREFRVLYLKLFLVSCVVEPNCWVLGFSSARHNRGAPVAPIRGRES